MFSERTTFSRQILERIMGMNFVKDFGSFHGKVKGMRFKKKVMS